MESSNKLMRGSLAVVLAVVPLLELGCLCPPCPAGAGATTAAATGPTPAAAAAPAGPVGNRLLIWDGDKVSPGQSWADCGKKDLKCKSTLTKTAGAGINGSAGMKWHVEGPDWTGAGWNWMGWYPQDSGTNIAGYSSLTFQIKVTAKSPDTLPDGDALAVNLKCGNSKIKACNTATLPVHRYVADYADGQWHKAVIPMSDLLAGDGSQFDVATAWELGFNQWSGPPRDFTVYVDDVAMEK